MEDDRLVEWVDHTVTGVDMKMTGLWGGLNSLSSIAMKTTGLWGGLNTQ